MMEKPKRPMSAYLLWLNSARAQIKADHPGLKGLTEVAKKAGELWRAMEDKSTWEKRAAAAKEQYAQDLEAFKATGAAAPPAKRGQKRASKPRQQKGKKERGDVKKEVSEDEDDDEEGPEDSE